MVRACCCALCTCTYKRCAHFAHAAHATESVATLVRKLQQPSLRHDIEEEKMEPVVSASREAEETVATPWWWLDQNQVSQLRTTHVRQPLRRAGARSGRTHALVRTRCAVHEASAW